MNNILRLAEDEITRLKEQIKEYRQELNLLQKDIQKYKQENNRLRVDLLELSKQEYNKNNG